MTWNWELPTTRSLANEPLISALKVKNVALALFFLDTDPSCSTEEKLNPFGNDRTPLQLAVATGDISIVKKLKDLGADFRIKDSYCSTNMMHFAALSGSIEMVEFVRTWPYLEKFEARHASIVPEAFWAAQSGNIECLMHLLKNPPDTKPLTIPRTPCWWEEQHPDGSGVFFSNGALDPLQFHCERGSILHYGVQSRSIPMVAYLTQECKVPLRLKHGFDAYAIHDAVSNNDLEMVEFLWPLYKVDGMGIDDLDTNGTLLFRAARMGSFPLVRFLVKEGASKRNGSHCYGFTSVLEMVNDFEYKFQIITVYINSL